MIFYLVTPLILIFASSLGLIINPSWSISPFIWVFVLVPIIDLVLPYLSKDDVEPTTSARFSTDSGDSG